MLILKATRLLLERITLTWKRTLLPIGLLTLALITILTAVPPQGTASNPPPAASDTPRPPATFTPFPTIQLPTVTRRPADTQTATPLATPPFPSLTPSVTTIPTLTPTAMPTPTLAPPTAVPSTPTLPPPTAAPQPQPTVPPPPPPAASSADRLIIPAISVDAPITPVGLDAYGNMAAPAGWFDIAWFRYGPQPGSPGSAAMAGHLDTNTGAPATFWNLGLLVPGNEVIYQTADGGQITFVVEETTVYPWDQAPLDRIFARSGDPRISLITCGGTWSREHRNYSHRVIVFARRR